MNSDICSFIQARLDESEQIAQDFASACWHVDYCGNADSTFHDRFDPAWIIADIESKRRILEDCSRAVDTARKLHGDDQEKWSPWSRQAWRTFQNLALPFATHPEYREEWRQ